MNEAKIIAYFGLPPKAALCLSVVGQAHLSHKQASL